MENNELKFYEEWEEGRLNKALINAIAFSFGQYDEHESWMKVRHAGAEIQFHQLEKHGRTNPGCVLDMGEISGALALLYAYSGYNTQILAGNIKIEKNLRLTKRKLNIESYIKLGIAKDWEHINKLNVNTVIICDLPDLVLSLSEIPDVITAEFNEMMIDNKCTLIITHSEFPVELNEVKVDSEVLDKIAAGKEILYQNEGNLVIKYAE